MIRYVAASLDLVYFDTSGEQRLARNEQTVRLSLASDRNHGSVLDRNPNVAFAGGNFSVQCALKLPCLCVRPASEIEKKSGPDGSQTPTGVFGFGLRM
jgi:hypothetical protein